MSWGSMKELWCRGDSMKELWCHGDSMKELWCHGGSMKELWCMGVVGLNNDPTALCLACHEQTRLWLWAKTCVPCQIESPTTYDHPT